MFKLGRRGGDERHRKGAAPAGALTTAPAPANAANKPPERGGSARAFWAGVGSAVLGAAIGGLAGAAPGLYVQSFQPGHVQITAGIPIVRNLSTGAQQTFSFVVPMLATNTGAPQKCVWDLVMQVKDLNAHKEWPYVPAYLVDYADAVRMASGAPLTTSLPRTGAFIPFGVAGRATTRLTVWFLPPSLAPSPTPGSPQDVLPAHPGAYTLDVFARLAGEECSSPRGTTVYAPQFHQTFEVPSQGNLDAGVFLQDAELGKSRKIFFGWK